MVGFSCTRAAIAWRAEWPAANSSSPRGPSRGSVRCCVSTAPTPARAKGQRLPTPILDVVTAAPNIPVSRHIPTTEKVMGVVSTSSGVLSVLHDSIYINLNEDAGTRKPIHNQAGPYRKDPLEGLPHHLIDWLPIG